MRRCSNIYTFLFRSCVVEKVPGKKVIGRVNGVNGVSATGPISLVTTTKLSSSPLAAITVEKTANSPIGNFLPPKGEKQLGTCW